MIINYEVSVADLSVEPGHLLELSKSIHVGPDPRTRPIPLSPGCSATFSCIFEENRAIHRHFRVLGLRELKLKIQMHIVAVGTADKHDSSTVGKHQKAQITVRIRPEKPAIEFQNGTMTSFKEAGRLHCVWTRTGPPLIAASGQWKMLDGESPLRNTSVRIANTSNQGCWIYISHLNIAGEH
jgi:hypothetical protein